MTQLIAPDGRPYRSSSPVETVRLKSKGYREEGEKVVVLADTLFHPKDHSVGDVMAYMEANPTDAARVIAEEKASQARKTIVGE